jgi:hypothetical protein
MFSHVALHPWPGSWKYCYELVKVKFNPSCGCKFLLRRRKAKSSEEEKEERSNYILEWHGSPWPGTMEN